MADASARAGAFDAALFDAAQADVLRCRAHYIAAVLAQTEGTAGRLSTPRSLLVVRSELHQALAIRRLAIGDWRSDQSVDPNAERQTPSADEARGNSA